MPLNSHLASISNDQLDSPIRYTWTVPKYKRKQTVKNDSFRSFLKRGRRDSFTFILYFFTVATPLFEIPQAVTIYSNHSAKDVSFLTWSFFIIDNLVWMAYGYRKKMKPLVITSILYLIIEIVVVIGIVTYT